ncbi:MAG: PTS sugar transporter subunit IIB [Spirochaetaceae bacterium]|jgi:PTS system cellobiose-specific IIB component|nr:PTS sugar transporter subunit IIB [Spirochaetaceae bacterium]
MSQVKIRVFCNAGMSTSMLVAKMREAVSKRGLDVNIEAYPFGEFDERAKEADAVLLGPQIGYEKGNAVKKLASTNIPVDVIPMVDYGMMNGEKVLDFALNLKK